MHKKIYAYVSVYKETPQHGDICTGCFRCLHCTSDRDVWAKDHAHDQWIKTLTTKIVIPNETVREWIISAITYCSGDLKLSTISFNVMPVFKDSPIKNHNIDGEIIARCKTYEEALALFEKHINRERRRIKAKGLK